MLTSEDSLFVGVRSYLFFHLRFFKLKLTGVADAIKFRNKRKAFEVEVLTTKRDF
jgi:hypothetical protein